MTVTAAAAGTHPPGWSARPYGDADREAVLAMFTAPDFYFRTAVPATRPEWEILGLVTEDETHVLLADGQPAGLYALEVVGVDHYRHYQLHLRLHSAPLSWWQSAYAEVIRAIRWRRELVRLAVTVGDFDRTGLTAARQAGLTEEGTLRDVLIHDGQRHGQVFFSRVWEPAP